MKQAQIATHYAMSMTRYNGSRGVRKITVICPDTKNVLSRGFRSERSAKQWAIDNGYEIV